MNATVLEILQEALGERPRRRRLARYATWTAEDVAEVERAVAAQRVVDEKLWRGSCSHNSAAADDPYR